MERAREGGREGRTEREGKRPDIQLNSQESYRGFLRRPIRKRRSGNPTSEAIIRGPAGRAEPTVSGGGRVRGARPAFAAGCHSAAAVATVVLWTRISCATAKTRVFPKNPANAIQVNARRNQGPGCGRLLAAASPLQATCPRLGRFSAGARRGSGSGRRLPPLYSAGRPHG